jgi:hypothetical protein
LYKKENERLAGERKDAEEVIRDMKAALQTTRTDAQRMRDELNKKRSENDKLRQEMEHLKGSTNMLRSLEAKLQETESMLASTRHTLDTTTNELKAMSEQNAQLHTLLNDRTFELKGAQSFLTTADASSGADVISVLQKLNAEVLQSAAYMAESMVDTFSFESGGVRNQNAHAAVTGLFGQSLAHYLATKKHKDDPLLIQITFQSCFVQFLGFVICSWTLPGDDVNRMFANTYERMRRGGECKQHHAIVCMTKLAFQRHKRFRGDGGHSQVHTPTITKRASSSRRLCHTSRDISPTSCLLRDAP